MERRKLFNDPDLEKIEIARFLVNNLTLSQLLTIEHMVKSGKLNQIMNEQKESEPSEKTERTPLRKVRFSILKH
jgi:hypothetical protein